MATTVVNIRNEPKGSYVYIGRRNSRYGLEGSIWENPYKSPQDGTLVEVLEKYRIWITSRPWFATEIVKLRGGLLGCWCRPKSGFKGRLMCHGQILAGLADGVAPESID
jgi:hypothetical protein